MVVYSIASRESLQSTSKWISCKRLSVSYVVVLITLLLTAARGAIQSSATPISVLVGNKSDLRDGTIDSRAEVTITEGKAFAGQIGCQFFEASAVGCPMLLASLFVVTYVVNRPQTKEWRNLSNTIRSPRCLSVSR